MDVVQGSTIDANKVVYDGFVKSLKDLKIDPNILSPLKPNSCFIPSISALGFRNSNFNWNTSITNRNLFCNNEIFFDNYFIPPTNEEHITLSTENVAWLTQEIDKGQPDCPKICSFSINGAYNLCINSDITYSLDVPVPSGYTTTWEPSAQYQIISYDNNSITIRGISNGLAFIKAHITNPCGADIKISKEIYVGKPVVSLQANNSAFDFCSLNLLQFDATVSNTSPPFSMHWSVIGNGARLKFGAGTASPVFFIRNIGTFEIIGEIINSCGTTNYSSGQMNGADLYSGCNTFRYSVSPNPAKENIKINFETGTITKKNIVFRLHTINNSHVVKEWNRILDTDTKQLSLSTLGLPGGHYILEAIHDQKKYSMHIVIE